MTCVTKFKTRVIKVKTIAIKVYAKVIVFKIRVARVSEIRSGMSILHCLELFP